MPAPRKCPKCGNVMPLLATSCLHCAPPLGQASPAEDEAPRFSVVRSSTPRSAPPPAAADPARPDEPIWYCRIGGQTIGPVTAAEIRDAFAKGQIDANASVGIRGKKDWFPIRTLPQFADLVTSVTRPAPGVTGGPAGTPPLRSPAPPSSAAAPPPPPPPGPPAREDETLIVPPLPKPGGDLPPGFEPVLVAWRAEARRLRRIIVGLALVCSGLAFLSAILAWRIFAR